MCGINGILNNSNKSMIDEVLAMNRCLMHRGPDNLGFWNSSDNSICLGHTRLSIIDTTSNGNQPMFSNDGNYVIVFNGEIYNFMEIRASLINNYDFRPKGNSDTECLLANIQFRGLNSTLEEISGMFSFALWDISKKCLFLAVDRMGEKPLYYSYQNSFFVFSSELKGVKSCNLFSQSISIDSVNNISSMVI